MAESLRAASEPITLRKCLEAMTREEELGEEEKYYCSECKKHQVCLRTDSWERIISGIKLSIENANVQISIKLRNSLQEARLKLQIWRLPPILIVQLKRFHYLNGKWIKSHKIVDFPSQNLDLAEYLAAVPSTTLKRHRDATLLNSLCLADGSIPRLRDSASGPRCEFTQPLAGASEMIRWCIECFLTLPKFSI